MAKSLKTRIDELIHAMGGADKPTMPQIRSRLFKFAALAEQLEQGKAVRKAESKVAALQSALEKSELENSKLGTELNTARDEIKIFKEAQKEREGKEREIPSKQFEIVERLPSEHGGLGLTMDELWREAGVPMDELEIHVDKLEKAGLIGWHMEAEGEKYWRRTMRGNELVVAKRLAGEADAKKAYKHADLPQLQHQIVLAILNLTGEESPYESEIATAINKSLEKTKYELNLLYKKGMASDGGQAQATYGLGQRWWLLDKAKEYLDERGLL